MKRINKYINIFSLCAFSIIGLGACSEDTMDKINSNDNNPLDVQAKFLIPQLETSTAFSMAGGDLSLYASVYMELEGGVHNQMYNAETRVNEPTSPATYNNSWETGYRNIKLARIIIKKCSEGGADAGNDLILGIGKLLLAYNAAVLTDLYGDVPYSQAGIVDDKGLTVYYQPKVDKQEDIYKDILLNIDEAIALFNSPTAVSSQLGTADYFYKGNVANWLKSAYGLKARYTMRLLAKSSDKTKDLNNIISYIDKSFTSSADEFKFAMYDGETQLNPLAAFSRQRAALAVSQSYVDKLKERKDPRLTQMFMNQDAETVTDPAKLYPAPNGNPIQSQSEYDIVVTDYSYQAPTQMLSYHELMFLKAEAYARLGNVAAAESALKIAISAGFNNLINSAKSTVEVAKYASYIVIPESVFEDYFNNTVKPLFSKNPIQEVMIQKYLASLGASGESLETYNDYRRMQALGESYIVLQNAKNKESFPKRYTYGNSDVAANPNIGNIFGDGTYVYTENVWWAGGTR